MKIKSYIRILLQSKRKFFLSYIFIITFFIFLIQVTLKFRICIEKFNENDYILCKFKKDLS